MASDAPLTIRNVTSTPIQLKSIAQLGQSIVARVEDAATADQYESGTTHQKVASSEDMSITVGPFETVVTDKKLASQQQQQQQQQQVRLTLSQRNEDHFIDIDVSKQQSKGLAPVKGDSEGVLTGIYYPSEAHLTIFSSANLPSWMTGLKDDTPVSALSIPGTHNAPAYHHALPSVRCQAVSPREQLQNGVRFMDIRVRVVDPGTDKLELVHAVFPVSLTGRKWFRGLVEEVEAFLAANPSETVLMTVKREGAGSATDQQLSRVLHEHYAGDAGKWFTAPRVPYLGEVRGKVVLIRRFALDPSLDGEYGGAGWCLDASAWADNTPDALTGSGDLRVQDFYGVMRSSQIKTKTEHVTGLLAKTSAVVSALPATATATASAQPTATTATGTVVVNGSGGSNGDGGEEKQPIFVNFLSASNFFNPRCWPEGIAAKLNPSVLEYLCTQHNMPGEEQGLGVGDGATGIVVCDWVGHKGNWDLIRAIVGWNARLIARETGVV